MYTEKLWIEGRRYTITHHDDGTTSEEPKIPESVKGRWTDKVGVMLDEMAAPSSKTDTDFHNNRGTLVDQLGGDEAWAKFCCQTCS